MPTYKMTLDVEIDAPDDPNTPELTLSREDAVSSVLDMTHLNKWRVWKEGKRTGNVRVIGVRTPRNVEHETP